MLSWVQLPPNKPETFVWVPWEVCALRQKGMLIGLLTVPKIAMARVCKGHSFFVALPSRSCLQIGCQAGAGAAGSAARGTAVRICHIPHCTCSICMLLKEASSRRKLFSAQISLFLLNSEDLFVKLGDQGGWWWGDTARMLECGILAGLCGPSRALLFILTDSELPCSPLPNPLPTCSPP